MVRDTLGADAVILRNQRTPNGIRVITALDYDETIFDDLKIVAAPESGTDAREDLAVPPAAAPPPDSFGELKQWFEGQLSQLAWLGLGQQQPGIAAWLRELARRGFAPGVAEILAGQLAGSGVDDGAALGRQLQRYLTIAGDDIVRNGGVLALVGPTGVGKTTTIAKLAARAAAIHGRAKVLLISADERRIGARDQLGRIASLLGVQMLEATDGNDLDTILSTRPGASAVLVDTAGMSQNDPALAATLTRLKPARTPLNVALTLAANGQYESLAGAIGRYSAAAPSAVILTKLDEAIQGGPALSAVIEAELPLLYTTDGQRIPDDLTVLADEPEALFTHPLLGAGGQAVPDAFLSQRLWRTDRG
ncbi:MAG: flagellar biosynthesis protein FlhF [Pseudomonadota bacterium]